MKITGNTIENPSGIVSIDVVLSDIEDVSVSAKTEAAPNLASLVDEMLDAQALVASCEATLDTARTRLREIAEKRFPEAMKLARSATWTRDDGWTANFIEDTFIDLPSESAGRKDAEAEKRRQTGIQFLHEHGASGIVKKLITTAYSKGEEAFVKETLARLEQERREGRVKVTETVNPQTLSAWYREQKMLRADAARRGVGSNLPEIPEDVFNVRYVRCVELSRKKVK